MNKYLAIIKIAYLSVLANRWHILIANLQAVFTLFVLFYFWQSVFTGYTTIRGYTFPQIITYYLLIRITYNRISTFTASRIAKDIKSGEITKYLLRPYDFTLHFICRDFTSATLWTFGNLFAISIFSFYFYRYLVLPPNIYYWLIFFIVYLLNGILSISINLIIGYVGFWIGEITHLKVVSTIFINIMSGGLIPLTFFPLWFQDASKYLPFQFLVQFPADVFFGRLSVISSITGTATLLLWVIGLYFLARHILRCGLKNYESYN